MISISVRRACLALALVSAAATAGEAQRIVLPGEDRILPGEARTLFTIGAEDGESWETFAGISNVAFDRADRLYVLDGPASRVLVFGPDGRFLRQLGREGDGPGELRGALAMDVTPDGRVVVLDLRAGALSVWHADGRFDRRVTPEGRPVRAPMAGLSLLPSGGVVLAEANPVLAAADGTHRSTHAPLVHLPLDGAPAVAFFDIPGETTVSQRTTEQAGGRFTVRAHIAGPPAFSPAVAYGALPDGTVALTFSSGYTIRIVDTRGRTLRYLQRPILARPVTDADRRALREDIAARLAASGTGTTAPASEPRTADSVAVIRRMRVTDGGRIWVQRGRDDWFGHGPIDLLDPAGRYLGTLRGQPMPDAVSASGRAAYIERDALDVPRVVVRQLPAGWR